MTSPLRIGFVGLGNIVRRRHLPQLRRLDGIEFTAVANRRPESSAKAAAELAIGRTFDDWRDLVAWDGVDVVWIGTYPDQHRAITEAALAAERHVFCQARMAGTLVDAVAMHDAASRSTKTTVLCPYSQYERGGSTVRRLLGEGAIGEPRHVLITSLSDRYADPASPLHWRQRDATFGRNMLDLGQLIEVQQQWLGYATWAMASTSTFLTERWDDERGRLEPVGRPDAVTAVVGLESGAVVTYVLSGVARQVEELDSIQIFGSEGTLVYRNDGDEILLGRPGQSHLEPVPIRPEDEPDSTVERRFVEAVRAGRKDAGPVSFSDGLAYMATTEAIAQSAETGRVVTVGVDEGLPSTTGT